MKVRRVILEGVNNFVERFDYSFEDEWTGQVPESLLLVGPNGSGKTTLLNVIAGLWQSFGEWMNPGTAGPVQSRPFSDLSDLIPGNCQLATIELTGLEAQPLWIFYTTMAYEDWTKWGWIVEQQETHRIGIELQDKDPRTLRRHYLPPGSTKSISGRRFWSWLDEWQRRFTENVLGTRADLPNVIFLESDARVWSKIEEPFQVVRESDEFNWLARYEPSSRREGSLENYLFTLSAVDRFAFDQIVGQVNSFLVGKRVAGFDPKTRELMVEVGDHYQHAIDQLSSGEQQVLLMIAFITRWLRPGGIVLVDEPDLHLHISLVNALVNHLRRMVVAKKGQLVIASHEPSLWKHFTQSHQVRLGQLDVMQR